MTDIRFHQKAIVLNGDGHLLALLRADTNKKWDLPGGAVEIPETHEAALRREIYEESNLDVSDIQPVDVQTSKADDGSYFIFIGFTCRVRSSNVTLSHEHADYKWVSFEEFLELDATPYLKEFIARVRRA